MESTKVPKIFIVEDNVDILEIYRLRFEVAGFIVVTSENGLDFVSRMHDEMPDVVLLDIMLPEMDGFSVLQSIKANFGNEDLKKIPIIAWSNLSQDEDVAKALTSGAHYYLRKSDYQGDDLVEKVRDILAKSRQA